MKTTNNNILPQGYKITYNTAGVQYFEPRLPEKWEVVLEGKIFNFENKKFWR